LTQRLLPLRGKKSQESCKEAAVSSECFAVFPLQFRAGMVQEEAQEGSKEKEWKAEALLEQI